MDEFTKSISNFFEQSLQSFDPNGKTGIGEHGLISCGNRVQIRHVPFDSPCIILVLSGQKIMIEKGQDIICNTGNALTVPSPGSYDLRNEPDRRSGRYRALVIPFEVTDIEHLLRLHQLQPHHRQVAPQILHFNIQADLANAIRHYLTPSSDDHLIRHRLLELLLILLRQDERLMTYSLCQPSWSQKVRSIFATDLAKKWEIVEVCQRLAISESTLRRNLKREQTGFRDLLVEQRLSAALMLLLQTSQSITQIAYDCGYLSVSRFSSNFSKRFGLPPTELRISLNESEQKMTVCEQS